MDRKSVTAWTVPCLLLGLGLLPILTGALSLAAVTEGLAGRPVPPESANYVANPVPILMHILAGSVFNLLGPFQFVPAIRRRWPAVHRWSGRVFLASGLVAGLCALWMNQFFPAFGGLSKYSANLVFGAALPISLALAYVAVRQRRIATHRAWMMRAYAIGLGVSTQRLLILPVALALGLPGDPWLGLLLWAGWLLNLAVVELILWRESAAGRRPVQPLALANRA